MPKLLLDYADGRYSTRTLSNDEAVKLEADGFDIAHVDDRVYDAYQRHCEQDGVWQALWRAISNEQYVRRRERELLPLEDAQREIDRLKEELQRSESSKRFLEETYARNLEARHREEWIEYTCVFPQPGCTVATLPPEWQESAREILERYNVKHAEEGLKIQGCCCDHAHRKLDDAMVEQLRGAGFLVEHDTERA